MLDYFLIVSVNIFLLDPWIYFYYIITKFIYFIDFIYEFILYTVISGYKVLKYSVKYCPVLQNTQ